MTVTIRRTYDESGEWVSVEWVIRGKRNEAVIRGVERVGFSQQTPRPPFLFELTEDEYDARWQDMMERLHNDASD